MLPRSNPRPPFDITRLSHVVLTARDLTRTGNFYAEVLGFQVREVTGDALYLSGLEERAHHSIVFERSDANPQCRALGFRVADEEELERAAHWFAQAGRAFEWVERPFQGRTMAVRDDTGTPLELTAEMGAAESLLQQFHRYRRGSPLRLDHVQVVSHDVGESANLYARLGFRITEYTYRAQTEEIWGIWLQRKGNRHDIVFSNGRGPRLHHFAFAVPEVRDLIHVCDAAASLGHAAAMERGPGRHGIGNALFVYFRDPDAHRIELFNGHYQAIGNEHAPIGWELGDTRRSQLWGLPARASWFFEATEFEGLAVRNSKLAALPVTLEDYLARAV